MGPSVKVNGYLILERREIMQKQTITVETFFGEKAVGIDEYEKKWVGTVSEVFWLADTREEFKRVEQMRKWIGEMARASFERGLAKERGEA